METTLQHVISVSYPETKRNQSLVSRFIHWADSQEKHRFGWVAAIIAGHGCVITPITLFAIILSGNNFIFWPIVLVAMAASLVSNLAAMPTKITIPVFFFTVLVDLAIIAICISQGFNIEGTYPHY
jgi:hypothetical protein